MRDNWDAGEKTSRRQVRDKGEIMRAENPERRGEQTGRQVGHKCEITRTRPLPKKCLETNLTYLHRHDIKMKIR